MKKDIVTMKEIMAQFVDVEKLCISQSQAASAAFAVDYGVGMVCASEIQ
jgi:hypothetical protein